MPRQQVLGSHRQNCQPESGKTVDHVRDCSVSARRDHACEFVPPSRFCQPASQPFTIGEDSRRKPQPPQLAHAFEKLNAPPAGPGGWIPLDGDPCCRTHTVLRPGRMQRRFSHAACLPPIRKPPRGRAAAERTRQRPAWRASRAIPARSRVASDSAPPARTSKTG